MTQISHIILIIKFFLSFFLQLFIIPYIFSKIFLLTIILFCLYALYKFPRHRFKKLSQVREYKLNRFTKYAIKTKKQNIYNWIIIVLYSMFTVIIIFILRFSNVNKTLDVAEKYILIKKFLNNASILDSLLNFVLFILILILYIWILLRLAKYFKFQIIRRHLFFVGPVISQDKAYWYQLVFFHDFLYKIILNRTNLERMLVFIYSRLYFSFRTKTYDLNFEELSYEKKYELYVKPPVEPRYFCLKYQKFVTFCFHVLIKWHYIFLFVLIIYDLWFNDFKLSLVFYALPWTFCYDFYVRTSTFIDNLWLPHDSFLYTALYCNSMEIWNDEYLLIDGNFYDYEHLKIIYKTYVLRDFVKDPNNI